MIRWFGWRLVVLAVIAGVEVTLGLLWHVSNMAGVFRPTGQYAICTGVCGPIVTQGLISMAFLVLIGTFFVVMLQASERSSWDVECGSD